MKHILKQRMIINESERSRILGLHDTFRNKVGGFLHEQNMDEATKFFMDQKTKFNKFPDGKVVPYGNTFGYEVVNTDGTKFMLLPNGTSVVDNGTGYKESTGYSWTKTPYVASAAVNTTTAGATTAGATTAGATTAGATTAGATTAGATTAGATTAGATVTDPTDPASKKEIRQGYRQRKADAATLKKEREDQLNLMNNEIKVFNDEIKKYKDVLSNARLTTKMTPEQKKGYETAIQNNTIKIQNKQAEINKLKATPLGGETVTTSTATVNPQTPKSREDQSAIDAGRGL
jgi:hypothetical protein